LANSKTATQVVVQRLVQEHNLEPEVAKVPLPEYCTPEWFEKEESIAPEKKYMLIEKLMLSTMLPLHRTMEKLAYFVGKTSLLDMIVGHEDFPSMEVLQWMIKNRQDQERLSHLPGKEQILAVMTLFQRDIKQLHQILLPYLPNLDLYNKNKRLWVCTRVSYDYKEFVQTYDDSFETAYIAD
jgi:hypothetical protein